MIRYLRILAVIFAFISCNNIKGKIEKRDRGCNGIPSSKRIFLVNNSENEKFKFTIKYIETIDDTINKYSTEQIILEPGDEKDLGCDLFFSDQKYLSIEKRKIVDDDDKIYHYENKFFSKNDMRRGAELSKMTLEEYLKATNLSIIPLYDTMHNNTLLKYQKNIITDSSKLLSQKKHKIKYEVTGQVNIIDDKMQHK